MGEDHDIFYLDASLQSLVMVDDDEGVFGFSTLLWRTFVYLTAMASAADLSLKS